jgi:hypothetical protein
MSAVRRQQLAHSGSTNLANFADEIMVALNMVRTDDFVQCIIAVKERTPQIVLYYPSQIELIKNFCCNRARGSVLTLDTTFNLSKDFYVTTTVLKNQSLLHRRTGSEPIFLGPVFLHGKLDYANYAAFIGHLFQVLEGCDQDSIVFGCDDDKALRKAIQRYFPQSALLACSLHLKKNARRHLADIVGLNTKRRQDILAQLFGYRGVGGLANVSNMSAFETEVFILFRHVVRK